MSATALKIEKAVRVFMFNKMVLQDPNPADTPEQVKQFYAGMYAELTNAEIEGPTQKGANTVYEFRKAVGTKGAGAELELDGVQLIAAERHRQIDQEGWTPEHDDDHSDHSLAAAACAYAAPEPMFSVDHYPDGSVVTTDIWPTSWDTNYDKRLRGDPEDPESGEGLHELPFSADDYAVDDRIRNLVKAGALLAAEIDRLIRKKAAAGNA